MGEKYELENGFPVEIIDEDSVFLYGVIKFSTDDPTLVDDSGKPYIPLVGMWFKEDLRLSGRYQKILSSILPKIKSFCLIKANPYKNFEIDDKVIIKWAENGKETTAYFAGVSDDGLPMVWTSGKTSWTTGYRIAVAYCRKPKENEDSLGKIMMKQP